MKQGPGEFRGKGKELVDVTGGCTQRNAMLTQHCYKNPSDARVNFATIVRFQSAKIPWGFHVNVCSVSLPGRGVPSPYIKNATKTFTMIFQKKGGKVTQAIRVVVPWSLQSILLQTHS